MPHPYIHQAKPSAPSALLALDGGNMRAQAPKFARYRSARQTNAQDSPGPGSGPGQMPTVPKSMSRYRRNRDPAAKVSALSQPPLPEPVAADKHRQDAMDRLTGGREPASNQPSLGPSRPASPSRQPNGLHRDPGASTSSGAEHKRRSWMEKMKLSSRSREHKSEPSHTAPGMDAPVSAVNSGERKVRVRYKTSTIILPVTPATRGQDLLSSAANYFAGVDPSTFILLESFTSNQIGLERPLRRYEYVRDVMNSWAYDNENSLLIIPPASAEALHPLDIRRVPAEKPNDTTFYIYHSQRPRKWDKRYVTLHADGQVTISKKQTKGHSTICHISDFDIYTPTVHTLSDVKPPKRICSAVKSQQKSSLFVSTDKFVHFFATDDRRVAEDWHKAVQSWRSWYIVNMLGAGDQLVDMAGRNEGKAYHSDGASLDHSSDSCLIDQAKSSPKELFSRRKGTREHAPPPSAFPRKLTIDTDSAPLVQDDGSPFSATGLLGHTYSMRQRDMRERESREKQREDEARNPHGLVNGVSRRQGSAPPSQRSSRSNTIKSSHNPDIAGLSKPSNSPRQPPPLVDLTPVFQEPPQHRNKGRGVTTEPGVPLVEAATGRDPPSGGIAIPPSTTWRRPPPPPPDEAASIAQSRTRYRSNTARSTNRRPPLTIDNRTAPSSPTSKYAPSSEYPFAPNSLLARSTSAAHGRQGGHGVATGDRNATEPMLDMSEKSPFAQGSLLRGS